MIVSNGKVREVGDADAIRVPAAADRIDASGLIVVPGFIDAHIHGAGGVDVMTGTPGALNSVGRTIARHGTTSFLPTTVSSPKDALTQAASSIGSAIHQTRDAARPLGIHLEGPFISETRRGTHRSSNLLPPDGDLFQKWIDASGSTIRLITVAPELDGVDDLIKVAHANRIRVAMGHSNATLEQSTHAADRGVCYAVHTFNAMRDFSHRDPGIIGAVLSDDRVFAEIIADGVHVHPSVVRFFARAKQANRVLLSTDAISAAGMPDGRYKLGGDEVTVTQGVCRDHEGRLAGSTLTQDTALKNFVAWTGFPLEAALLALTRNPADALGLTGKGVLEPGADADFVVMDSTFRVMKTFVAGKLVFER